MIGPSLFSRSLNWGSDVTQWMRPSSREMHSTLPSRVTTKRKSPATHGVWTPLMSRSHMRAPLARSMATMRPPWLMAKTRPWSIAGLPLMSLSAASEPTRVA